MTYCSNVSHVAQLRMMLIRQVEVLVWPITPVIYVQFIARKILVKIVRDLLQHFYADYG